MISNTCNHKYLNESVRDKNEKMLFCPIKKLGKTLKYHYLYH